MSELKVIPLTPNTFELEDYSPSDDNLISQIQTSVTYNPQTDYIEYFIYNPNNGGLVYPFSGGPANYNSYTLEDNILSINFEEDLRSRNFYSGDYNVFYNFLSLRLSSSYNQRYYISEISSDRTEIRLASNTISVEEMIASTNEFISERDSDQYYPDFYLNFGNNQLVIANNITLDGETILIKLYEPLLSSFQLKSTLWVVEQVADPIAYLVSLPNVPIVVDDSIKLKGPNFNLNVKTQVNNSTEPIDYNTLVGTNISSSLQQINSYYEDPSVAINVDYTEFNNFIHFSSAQKRISNFFYKLEQIENWTSLAAIGSGIAVTTTSASTAFYQNLINETITNFDNYEYYLYFSSGSTSYPKSNSSSPYNLYPTTSPEAQTWITSSLTSGLAYDENNSDWIYYAIPEYIREDSLNQSYLDFCNMVGHFYDENVWVYIKDITNKWDNDNRINAGISPDLIAQQLRDLGFNIYENNFSSFNLFSSTLGITPSGSYFPYPNMTGSLPTPTGYEYVNSFITGSNEILPQDLVNKRIYKRLYNALPYLYKKKGTVDGIRALATIYGIPNTLLRINEFGGKDKDNTNDWDYWFEEFNYKYNTNTEGFISSSWVTNPSWGSSPSNTVQFRFKTPGLDSALAYRSQSLWALDTDVYLVLEYTGSGYASGSFSGSIPDPYNEYAHLTIYPDYVNTPAQSASVYLPFFNGDWWSVMATLDSDVVNLYAGNKIYSGSNGSQLGFYASQTVTGVDDTEWLNGTTSYFASASIYPKFSGSLQEIRYYSPVISASVFQDYIMNPQSIEGNGINSGSNELAFRASLGGELYTGSVSIHPKVTGSWAVTSSFGSDSNFYITGSFESNTEYVFIDQPAVGIKNRITDKIRNVSLNLPSGNTLSNKISIQQNNESSKGYTNSINLVEVALSPTDQINDDINSSLGYLNIGEYIGDPRQAISGSTTYPPLNDLRDNYFLKYTSNYDWNDFIRLIKFFDNSLFNTIKDFVPAKVSLASGITIKQHLLERNKYPVPSASYSEPEYTGSIGQIPGLLDGQRIYTASNAYESFPIESITGSQGGTLPNLVNNTNYTVNQFVNVTQSWGGTNITPFGFETFVQDDTREFFNGEFSGSNLVVTTQSLNTECDAFMSYPTTVINYDISSSFNPSLGAFTNQMKGGAQYPGKLYLWWDKVVSESDTIGYNVFHYYLRAISISKTSANSLDLEDYIPSVVLYNLLMGLSISDFNFTGTGFQIGGPSGTNLGNLQFTTTNFTELQGLNDNFYLVQVYSNSYLRIECQNTPTVTMTPENAQIVIEPYVIDTFENSNCNPVYGNELIARQSNIFWDLDFQTNAIQAVNQQTIITASQQGGNLPKAFVQDYNWYSTPIKTWKYLGAKSESPGFNQNASFAGGPLRGYGTLPVIQSEGLYFGYFNWVGGTSPEWGNNLKDRTAVNFRYFIDENGNVIEPINDSNGVNLSIVQQNFEQDSNAILSFDDTQATTPNFANLEGLHPIFKSGQRIIPIIYTQTSSVGSDNTKPNAGGGATGSIDFVFGDIPPGTVAENYTMYSYAGSSVAWQYGAVPFSNNVQLGQNASWTTNLVYSPITVNPTDNNVTLYFEVQINFELDRYDFISSCYFQKKIGGTWYDVGSNYQIGLQGNVDGAFNCTYQDATAVAGDEYRFRVAYINNQNIDPSDNSPIPPFISTTSYFRVYQQPLSTALPCTLFWENYPTPGTPSTQIKAVDNNFPSTVGLKYFYGQRQTDISGSGFYPITSNFTVQVGDEIRFEGTETQAYYIREVDTTGGDIILTLDRICTANDLDYFLLRRYINDPSYILLSVDKPSGGTAPGILTPEYFYSGTNSKMDNLLAILREKQLI